MMNQKIPTIIHYCWFGGNPLPELAQKCIASWKKYCPEYEIREWNESCLLYTSRLAFRQMFDAEGYEVVAINDLTSPKMLAHLLKYDTAQGSFCGKIGEGKHTVESTEDSIIVDGKEIKIYAVKDAKDAPWGELNVDVVLECTGFYTSKRCV